METTARVRRGHKARLHIWRFRFREQPPCLTPPPSPSLALSVSLTECLAHTECLSHRVPLSHCVSTGSGVGLPLVTQSVAGDVPTVSGVIVEGGFSSIVDVAHEAVPLLLPHLLLRHRFDNIPHARALTTQVTTPPPPRPCRPHECSFADGKQLCCRFRPALAELPGRYHKKLPNNPGAWNPLLSSHSPTQAPSVLLGPFSLTTSACQHPLQPPPPGF